MLHYFFFYVFVVASFASEHKILGPESLKNLTEHKILAPPEISDPILLESIGQSDAETLLSQLLSVNPKDVSQVVDLIKKLIAQATKEIASLDNRLASAKQDMDRKVTADNAAQVAKDNAHAALKQAQAAYEVAKLAKDKSKVARDRATIHHKEMTDIVSVEKPELQAQLKVLNKVLALLNPLEQGPKLADGRVIRNVQNIYKTFDYSFDLYLNRFDAHRNSWQNVFQLAYASDNKELAAFWIHSTKRSLHFGQDRMGGPAYVMSSFPLKKWNHIQIKQVLSNGKYMNSIIINGKIKQTIENKKPKEFQNVNVFAAGRDFLPADGFLKNFVISSKRA